MPINNISKKREPLNRWQMLLIGLSFVGLCLIAWGATSNFPFLTSLGGAFFGSCLGAFIGRVAKSDLVEEIKQTVIESIYPTFTTKENIIERFRREWHVYHVTQMNGKFVWRHSIVDFKKNRIPGRLIAEASLKDKRGNQATYVYEGGVRDERLLLLNKEPGSTEPTGVYVFPFSGLRFEDRHFGVIFHQTYDSPHSISPALLTRDPIPKAENEGTISDAEAVKLDNIWRKAATQNSMILPRIITSEPVKGSELNGNLKVTKKRKQQKPHDPTNQTTG